MDKYELPLKSFYSTELPVSEVFIGVANPQIDVPQENHMEGIGFAAGVIIIACLIGKRFFDPKL